MSNLKSFNLEDGILVSSDRAIILKSIEIQNEDEEVVDIKIQPVQQDREIYEWYALTKTAAENAKNQATQPEDGAYSYAMVLDSRVVNGYVLRREWIREIVGPSTSLDACANPTFAPGTGTYEWPLSVVISSTTPGAMINYAYLEDGVLSSWTSISSGGSVSVPEPAVGSIQIKAFAFRAGRLPSDIVSATYTVEDD